MNKWNIFFKGVVLIIGLALIAFNVLLYNSFEKQKADNESTRKQLLLETQVNENKFKYQQEHIEGMSKDLEGALQQIKDQELDLSQQKDALNAQKDALLQEIEKRQQIENESKGIQTSLVDIKAEADAIKQDMKSWQKDYVTVLAELDKKMDDSKAEIQSVKDNLDSLNIPELKGSIDSLKADVEKISQPTDSQLTTK